MPSTAHKHRMATRDRNAASFWIPCVRVGGIGVRQGVDARPAVGRAVSERGTSIAT